jgi:predicted aldo/keto reductase-like oxidoreductase
MPCPQKVNIPEIFRLYNSYNLMKDHWVDKGMYMSNILPSGTGADKCIDCGICARNCPQGIKIPDKLKEVHKAFIG